MSTKYCTNCGTKHEYTLDVPKFCQNCGTSFGGAPIKQQSISSKKEVVAQTIEDDGLEDADKEVPSLSKIQIEIEVQSSPKIQFGQAKNSASFAREKPAKELTVKDLETRLETLFERDRKEQKE